MTDKVYRPYLGAGQVYAKKEGVPGGLVPVGNVSELKLSIDEDVKELQDYTHPGGGTYAEVRRIKSISVSMSLHDLNIENLSRAVFGTTGGIDAGSITDEEHVAYKGSLITLAHIRPSGVPVSVGTDAKTEGVDFEVRPEGLFIPETSTIADGATITVSYSYGAYGVIEALTESGIVLAMRFGGVNEADSGNPVVVDLYRVSLGAAKDVSFIGDDFASLSLEGKLLVDPTKSGAGQSRYMKISMV